MYQNYPSYPNPNCCEQPGDIQQGYYYNGYDYSPDYYQSNWQFCSEQNAQSSEPIHQHYVYQFEATQWKGQTFWRSLECDFFTILIFSATKATANAITDFTFRRLLILNVVVFAEVLISVWQLKNKMLIYNVHIHATLY